MLKISVNDAQSLGTQLGALQMRVFVIQDDASGEKEIKKIEKKYYPGLSNLTKQQAFTGASGTTLIAPILDGQSVSYLVLAGIGKKKNNVIDVETYRRAVGRIMRTAQAYKCTSLAIELPSPALFKVTLAYLAQQTAIVARMAIYHYDRFLTDKDHKQPKTTIDLVLVVPTAHKASIKKEISQANIIAESVNLAREWVDTPPGDLTPPDLADNARAIAKKYGLGIKVFDEKKIKQMGMGGLAAVSAGSDRDCQVVILEYN